MAVIKNHFHYFTIISDLWLEERNIYDQGYKDIYDIP